MSTIQLTLPEIIERLAKKYLGKVIIHKGISNEEVCGKVDRITCEVATAGEPMVIFVINRRRYEVDINYFLENTEIHKKGTPSL